MKNLIPVIGLEVHIEPNTITKMFCGCPQDYFGKEPNSQTCPICLGLPGALPYANKEAVLKTVKLGLALGSKISTYSRFYRKHYFYPDLPKAFQTSQKDEVLCVGGDLLGKKLNHIHLEEDSGKLVHETIDEVKYSLVDFNRSGCALIELVTEPVFHSVADVLSFVKELQLIVRYIDVSGCDMEKGTMRLEANVSMSRDERLPDYKVELKNINSFRFLEKALNAELTRQKDAHEIGEKLIQETRGYDEVKQVTYSQRTKEMAQDYRYFPEADIPPIGLSNKDIKILRDSMPELPENLRKRFRDKYGLRDSYIEILIADKNRASYFEEVVKVGKNRGVGSLMVADMMVNKNLDRQFPEASGLVEKILELKKTGDINEEKVENAVDSILKDATKAVSDFKSGKVQVVGYLIGLVQKRLGGKVDPKIVRDVLMKKLKSV